MANEKAAAKSGNGGNGNGGDFEKDSKGRKLYTVTTIIENEKFVRKVPLIGIPFWVPQKRTDQSKIVVGYIEEVVQIEANEELGFAARRGLLLETKDSYLVIPAGAAIDRQIDEAKLAEGTDGQAIRTEIKNPADPRFNKKKVVVEFLGIASKPSKPGRAPAIRMNVSVYAGPAPVGQMAPQVPSQTITA